MRIAAIFLFGLLMFTPLLASAVTQSATLPVKCPKGGSTGDPQGEKAFSPKQKDELKTYMDTITYCANPCYDVTTTLAVKDDGTVVFTTKSVNNCKDETKIAAEQKPPRGCAKDQKQPQITANVPAVTRTVAFITTNLVAATKIGPKSRCNPEISNVVSSMVGRAETSDLAGYKKDLAALQSFSTEVPPQIVNPQDPSQYEQVLRAYGMTDDAQIKDAIENKPDAVKAIADCAAKSTACTEESFNKATAELKLNSNLKDLSQFKADWEEAQKKEASPETPPTREVAGFEKNQNETGVPTQCGISGLSGLIMRAESSCGRINSNPLSSVQGPYHYLCGTWQRDTAATGFSQYSDCQYRNSVEISTKVVDAVYDQHKQKYGNTCESMGLSWTSCAYGIHVFGEGGFRNMLGAYSANPNASALSLCGSALATNACTNNISIFRNGGTVAGVFGELDRRLTGSSVIPSVATYGSPFGVFGNTNTYTPLGGSPFAQVNPFTGYVSTGNPVSTGSPVSTGGVVSTGGPVSTGGTVSTGGVTSGGTALTGTTPAPIPATPVASLIVQPRTILQGDPLTVSWASVGMRLDAPCIVQVATSSNDLFAQGNEGSKTVRFSQVGTYTFTLKCNAVNGLQIQQATSVRIQ